MQPEEPVLLFRRSAAQERAAAGMWWSRMGKRPRSTPGKKPPAPSVSRRRAAGSNITAQIADEIHTALERLDADEELLAIVGSWRDTLPGADVLRMLVRTTPAGRRCIGHSEMQRADYIAGGHGRSRRSRTVAA
jgi:hypothetical protein